MFLGVGSDIVCSLYNFVASGLGGNVVPSSLLRRYCFYSVLSNFEITPSAPHPLAPPWGEETMPYLVTCYEPRKIIFVTLFSVSARNCYDLL